MEHFFEYGQKETDWLKSRDKKLSAVIEQVGCDRASGADLPTNHPRPLCRLSPFDCGPADFHQSPGNHLEQAAIGLRENHAGKNGKNRGCPAAKHRDFFPQGELHQTSRGKNRKRRIRHRCPARHGRCRSGPAAVFAGRHRTLERGDADALLDATPQYPQFRRPGHTGAACGWCTGTAR